MAFYEFYTMELPIFVPSDAGRYMWQQLPGHKSHLHATCGDYAAWVGTFELGDDVGTSIVYTFDCEGNVDVRGAGAGKLVPMERMDVRGFTHCMEGVHKGAHVRLRLQRSHLQMMHTTAEV